MFDFQQMYREKLRTPEAAVECVKDGDINTLSPVLIIIKI